MMSPTPSTSASSPTEASEIESMLPKVVASACADVGPTWRIDSATSVRHNGRVFASSSAPSNFSRFLPWVPSFFLKNSEFIKDSSVKENKSASSVMILSVKSATAASYPRTSISKAARDPM